MNTNIIVELLAGKGINVNKRSVTFVEEDENGFTFYVKSHEHKLVVFLSPTSETLATVDVVCAKQHFEGIRVFTKLLRERGLSVGNKKYGSARVNPFTNADLKNPEELPDDEYGSICKFDIKITVDGEIVIEDALGLGVT
jgi:predicted RNA-binding protein